VDEEEFEEFEDEEFDDEFEEFDEEEFDDEDEWEE